MMKSQGEKGETADLYGVSAFHSHMIKKAAFR